MLLGGFAVIAHGGARTTKDIDLLIDAHPANVARVREALQILEDKAVNDVADEDVARYSMVRVADEIVIDLMAQACGVDYADASRDAVHRLFDGVPISCGEPTNAHPDQEHDAAIRRRRPSLPAGPDRRSGAVATALVSQTDCRSPTAESDTRPRQPPSSPFSSASNRPGSAGFVRCSSKPASTDAWISESCP